MFVVRSLIVHGLVAYYLFKYCYILLSIYIIYIYKLKREFIYL